MGWISELIVMSSKTQNMKRDADYCELLKCYDNLQTDIAIKEKGNPMKLNPDELRVYYKNTNPKHDFALNDCIEIFMLCLGYKRTDQGISMLNGVSDIVFTKKNVDSSDEQIKKLQNQVKNWEDTARQYCKNADYWRERVELAEAHFEVEPANAKL